jgi:DNA polymerase-3 subunit delta'
MAFNKLLGNDTSKEILLNSLKEGRLSHSYIFSGPSGVGKKLFAIEFAKLINCNIDLKDRQEDCNCSSCSKIEKMIHPDVILLM